MSVDVQGQSSNCRDRWSTRLAPMIGSVIILGSLLGSAAPAHSHQPVPAPAGLTHWWPGDNNNLDIVGGLNAKMVGGTSFRKAYVRKGLSLDGIDDYAFIPSNDRSLNFGMRDFTVDLWVLFHSLQGEQVIIEKYIENFSPDVSGWTLTKLGFPEDTIRFATSGRFSPTNLDVSPPNLQPQQWNLISLRRKGNNFAVFWNGDMIGNAAFDPGTNLNSSASLKFGKRCSPSDTPGCLDDRGCYLGGFIDEVEIFNRALTLGEIRSIYQAGRAGKIKPPH